MALLRWRLYCAGKHSIAHGGIRVHFHGLGLGEAKAQRCCPLHASTRPVLVATHSQYHALLRQRAAQHRGGGVGRSNHGIHVGQSSRVVALQQMGLRSVVQGGAVERVRRNDRRQESHGGGQVARLGQADGCGSAALARATNTDSKQLTPPPPPH